jgi:hypothetical protein
VFTTGDRIASFLRELEFWKKCVEGRQYECFPSLNDFLTETEPSLEETIHDSIFQHMNGLQRALQKYFPFSTDDVNWVRNPFYVSEKPDCMSVQNYECFIEITTDTSLKQIH